MRVEEDCREEGERCVRECCTLLHTSPPQNRTSGTYSKRKLQKKTTVLKKKQQNWFKIEPKKKKKNNNKKIKLSKFFGFSKVSFLKKKNF
jgi:hypothetical protein